ncbi:tRNA 2-selenouridine(34) synthase MnmH [Sporosarcina sp. P37]|uniref:tRNA 2-selenouridine(34) synthase MnmH n=1 Tax=unclassified Sporosarcina TaxID=2647733 RepID=UPI0009BE20A8|nr:MULTISPECIES: tRNA 2-selenouridine(34) synthase MnmH [unclassified Sporosarcina]ARD48286.1 tRNA 2-selenouridine synthase [Sporosarcina sp. P33]ARK24790.1 tRNA 2-selenouridine(34) synthase MnmH [Sporosarcina sp. P37]PID19948.1 tRNA 2-selenouridine(34) synthase MnmH [Sporosarcina sp. P35]
MVRDITLKDALELQKNHSHTLVDVRSPKEFEEATIPGSINIPVFTNEERAEVGTLYKQAGKEAAMDRGLVIFSRKLPAFIEEFRKIETPLTVFCWRGGMRSKTAMTVLELMGIRSSRISGGIHTYRQWVIERLQEPIKPQLLVLNGYTGSGKTKVLHKLREDGCPVIDLEGMAGHRGSIFGQIGVKPNNQKKFELLLADKLVQYANEPYVFIEGESKRIGQVHMPQLLFAKKEQSPQWIIRLPIEERVEEILSEYEPEKRPEQFLEAFSRIRKRIHQPVAVQIQDDLENGRFAEAVEQLLTHYYDPQYKHSVARFAQEDIIQAATVQEAYEQCLQRYRELMK